MNTVVYLNKYSKGLLALCGLLSLLLTASCGVTRVDVAGTYPAPLVQQIPLTVGVYYDDSFRDFSYTETNERTGKEEIIVNSGQTQVELFNTVLPAVFSRVVQIEDLDQVADHPELDVVFVPVIQEFQLGLPQKTRLSSYEIWIKYNMRLSEADGEYIADWVMTAYGKSPTETFNSDREGITNATVEALRDLAASFALGFTRIPEVNEWLQQQTLPGSAELTALP